MANEVTIREQGGAVAPGEMTVEQVLAQVEKIHDLMRRGMKEGEHYGVIPGTAKPTLLKAGAEKLCLMFRLAPSYSIIEKELPNGHTKIISTCTLTHIPSDTVYGSGMGSCSTRESKYAYRKAERTCPTCGKPSIIKGQAQYGGGWVCWKKKDGCGAQFKDGNRAIEEQQVGRIDNPDIADQENTVLKMSNKRSLCAGILNVTAASDVFTQDLEDLRGEWAETAKAAEGAPPESSADGSAGTGNGRGGRRLKVKPDQGEGAKPAEAPPSGGPTPPPGESVVMVDAAMADAQLGRMTKLGVVVDAVLKQIGQTRASKGEGPAPQSLRDLTLKESEWVGRILDVRDKQQGA